MEKRSQRHHMQRDNDHIGCMWGLIQMFDFRRGGSPHKKISNRRSRSRYDIGVRKSASKVRMLTDFEESQSENDHKESISRSTVASKSSLVKLLHEELFIETKPKERISSMEVEEKESQPDSSGIGRKNRKRTNKTRKKPSDMSTGENHSLDIDSIMDEIHSLIRQRGNSCTEQSGFEEKLSETAKVFLTKTLQPGDQKLSKSEEAMNVFRTIISNKELFMELVKDPSSTLAKHIQTLKDTVSKTDEKSCARGEMCNTRKLDVFASRRKHTTFKKKMKFAPRKSRENENSQALSQIVILKPVPADMRKNHGISQFSFAEIKRKLKRVMGKERFETSYLIPNRIYRKKIEDDDDKPVERKSLFRNPVYVKNLSQQSVDQEKLIHVHSETESCSGGSVSDIYVEAKKHLSEMLTNGSDNEDSSSRQQLSQTLRGILSLPEYSVPPLYRSVRECEHETITAQMRFPCHDTTSKSEGGFKNDTSSEGDVEVISAGDYENFNKEPNQYSSTEIDPNEYSLEISDEQVYPECVTSGLVQDTQTVVSPLASESSSSMIPSKVEDVEIEADKTDRLSPISVLEPLFADDETSPTSIKSPPSNSPITPLQIRFEEQESSSIDDEDSQVRTFTEDIESIFEYCETILQTSGILWEDLYMKILSSNQILDPTLLDKVVFVSNDICHDQKLLFDCINQILAHYYICSPWVSFIKPTENFMYEVCEGIEWYITPLASPQTLEQIVRKDLMKSGKIFDLRFDIEEISIDISDAILDELMGDTVLRCYDDCSGITEPGLGGKVGYLQAFLAD